MKKTPNRFDYVAYDKTAVEKSVAFKTQAINLKRLIEKKLPFDKATSAAKTKALNALEVCYMWLGKALRDEQIDRNGSAEMQEGRNDS